MMALFVHKLELQLEAIAPALLSNHNQKLLRMPFLKPVCVCVYFCGSSGA